MTTDTDRESAQHGYISDKKRYLDRLKRIEGQARGISRMVDEESTASTSSPRSPL